MSRSPSFLTYYGDNSWSLRLPVSSTTARRAVLLTAGFFVYRAAKRYSNKVSSRYAPCSSCATMAFRKQELSAVIFSYVGLSDLRTAGAVCIGWHRHSSCDERWERYGTERVMRLHRSGANIDGYEQCVKMVFAAYVPDPPRDPRAKNFRSFLMDTRQQLIALQGSGGKRQAAAARQDSVSCALALRFANALAQCFAGTGVSLCTALRDYLGWYSGLSPAKFARLQDEHGFVSGGISCSHGQFKCAAQEAGVPVLGVLRFFAAAPAAG